ncbi:unnamed protein product, partial [Rotaria sordida]
MNFRSSS